MGVERVRCMSMYSPTVVILLLETMIDDLEIF